MKSPFESLAAPAQRALKQNNIHTIEDLAQYRSADILKFHGIGPNSIPKLIKLLSEKNLSFKNE